ncbi:MAG TPA: glycoside hydrolase family 43 protein [Phycisphaerae bacterium]|nr:glycoside hydrolase family 43 protein [Phycisphaerae bacterium]
MRNAFFKPLRYWALAGALLLGVLSSRAQTLPPVPNVVHLFVPGALWMDNNNVYINAHGGGILYYGGVYYWFGEHKIAGKAGNVAQVGVHVYSSTDLYSWQDRGIALAVAHDPGNDIVQGCILERPKVVYNDLTGKFVMWFHLELKGHGYDSARLGVATAENPTGPYRYQGSMRINAGFWPENFPADERQPLTAAQVNQINTLKKSGADTRDPGFADLVVRRDFAGGQMARDMTVYVDDDRKAYLIYASEENSTIEIAQLSDDYLKPDGTYIRILVSGYNEAPTIFKHDEKYFLITSGQHGWSPCDARLAEADSILGDWKALGNPCRGTPKQMATTFESQGTFVLPVPGNPDAFIFMADRWRPNNAIDGRYVWLPIQWDKGIPYLQWKNQWNLDFFNAVN